MRGPGNEVTASPDPKIGSMALHVATTCTHLNFRTARQKIFSFKQNKLVTCSEIPISLPVQLSVNTTSFLCI